jgi:hypothetical protein
MNWNQAGSTLLAVVLSIPALAIAATLIVPRILGSRMEANEQQAIVALRLLANAQAQCRESGVIDVDQDGRGEFGYFGELTGGAGIRNDEAGGFGSERILPPYLGDDFARVGNRMVIRAGYCFMLYLPDAVDDWIAESPLGGAGGCKVTADRAELRWACMAWPATYDSTGRRAFYLDERGILLASPNRKHRYSGRMMVPAPAAAALDGESTDDMAAALAVNAKGQDGEIWSRID